MLKPPLLLAQPAGNAEVDRDDGAVGLDEQIAGMHVGMEEAVAQRVAQERLDQVGGDRLQVVAGRLEGGDVVHLDAVDPLHGQDIASGALPVHGRHAKAGVAPGVLAELRKGCRLEPQVHFDPGGLRQCLRHLDRPQPPRGGNVFFLQPGGQEIAFEIVEEAPPHAGTDHLHRHFGGHAVMQRLGVVHLGDGRGRHRVAEAQEQIVDLAPERRLDRLDRLPLREGVHLVLQQGEIERHGVADDVGPRRQELAELHVRRPQPDDRLGQAVAALVGERAPAGEQPGKAPAEFGQARQFLARQGRDDALADQHPAGPRQPKPGANCAHDRACLKASSPNAARRCRRNSCGR